MADVPFRPFLILFPAIGIPAGLALGATGHGEAATLVWSACVVPVLVALIVEIVTSLRRGDVGLDVVAALSMSAALATGEALAAAVVALMYAGGQYLEAFAESRARRDMTALLSRVPRSAMRHRNGGLEEVALDAIAPGDRLLIRRGDTVPVDGTVAAGLAVLDQSALTGESLPVQLRKGAAVMSGSTNAGEVFDLVATHKAAESTYAAIVRLVEAASRAKAPMARLADRFAIAFLAVTVAIAGAAWWFTGDPIRAVAVLVVATPCPLILAVPVAIVAGLSRAARHGILVKGGKALENLARIRAVVLDKTGTLTAGRARIVAIDRAADLPEDEILRIAASLDIASQHIIAQTIVAAARARGLTLGVPRDVIEVPGEGLEGRVDDRHVVLGGRAFVLSRVEPPADEPFAVPNGRAPGAVTVAVAVDGRLAGEIVLADELRAGAGALVAKLRRLGIARIVIATGDRRDVADAIARDLDIDGIRAELTPDQKVLVVIGERKHGPVMMVGDGVNDAPALAAADIGLAMGARGAAASAEAGDVVLLVDDVGRVVPAIEIARRSRQIALQSVYAGIGLSVAGMVAAAFGLITPVQGALLQEVIDVAVILNALRALRDRPGEALVAAPVRSGEPASALPTG